jgi:hypothetical protein
MAQEMNLTQMKSSINRHFRNLSMRQKAFKAIERKSCDARIEVMRRKIPDEVQQMIRRSQSEPTGTGVLVKLRLPPRATRRPPPPVEHTVQVGIARPLVRDDLGTSDLYANWMPGKDGMGNGSLVALPYAISRERQLGGFELTHTQLEERATSYTLRQAMERNELDNELVDNCDVIIVRSNGRGEEYDNRIATASEPVTPPQRKHEVLKKSQSDWSLGQTRRRGDESGFFAPIQKRAGTNEFNNSNRELSVRSPAMGSTISFDKSLDRRPFGFYSTVDAKYHPNYSTR